MADVLKDFGYSTVATAPSPATTGTSLVVAAGDGARMPTPPFTATVWPSGSQPLATNAEKVRVTAIVTDTLTITRAVEGSSARSIVVGDQIAATITAQFLGMGLVNRNPTYDMKIPTGHSVVVAESFRVPANVSVEIASDGILRVL